jgi:hypothetical protein
MVIAANIQMDGTSPYCNVMPLTYHGELMKVFPLLFLIVSFLGGCASSGTQTLKTNDPRECAQNFTYDGSFLAGRKYNTHAFVKNVSQKEAMKRATLYTLNHGWQIINTNEEMGFISASRTVSYGQGKTVPLNITIESINNDVKVSMTYATSGGVTSPLEAITKHFCSTIEAIDGKQG